MADLLKREISRMKRVSLLVAAAVAFLSLHGMAEAAAGPIDQSWLAPNAFTFNAVGGHQETDLMDPAEVAREMRRFEQQHEEEISTAAAVRERLASADEFTDLSTGQAIDLVTDTFQEPLEALTSLPSDYVQSSETTPIFNAGSDTSVRIDPPGPEDSLLVVSDTPLRNEQDQLISGEIVASEGAFAPVAPLANVKMPAQANGPVELSDVGVDLNFADANDSGGQLVNAASGSDDEMVFYPNTQTDTDTAITYTLQGVETFNYLRSEDSPESFEIEYTVPQGAALRSSGDGGAIIVDGQDEILATISAPYAIDAQGTNVPMDLAVTGSSVVLQVPHRGKDFGYPIMVDPVTHIRDWWTNGSSAGYQGWAFTEEGSSNYSGSNTCPASVPSTDPCKTGTGAGVYVSMVPNTYYAAGSKAYWRWTVPGGTDSYIASADMNTWRYREGANTHGWAFYNVYNGDGETYTDPATGGGMPLNGGINSKYIHVGLMTSTAFTMPAGSANWRYNRLAAYTAALSDRFPPSLSLSGSPTSWIGPNTPFNVTATAQDSGLGLGWITATVNGSPVNKWLGWCTGTYPNPCPTTPVVQSMPFNSNDFPTGFNAVPVKATDIVSGTGHEAGSNFSVKVDRTKPVINTSGSLTNSPFRGNPPRHTFEFDIRDGSSGASQSGIEKVIVTLDGQVISSHNSPCATQNCHVSTNEPWEFEAEDWGYNTPHVLKIEAEDTVGNPSTKTIDFTFVRDVTPPALTLGSFPSGRLSANPQISFSSTDVGYGVANVAAYVAGEAVEVTMKEDVCTYGDCPYSGDLKLDLNQTTAGPMSVQFVATDAAGNESAPLTRTIEADSTLPALNVTGDLLDFDEKPMNSGTGDLDIATSDNASVYDTGIKKIEVFLNGVSAGLKTNTCSPTCPGTDTLEYTFDRDVTGAGPHEIKIETTDGIGNVTTEGYTIDVEPEIAEVTCEATPTDVQPSGTVLTPGNAEAALETNVPPLGTVNTEATNSLNGEEMEPAFVAPDPDAGVIVDEPTDDFVDQDPMEDFLLDESHPNATASTDATPEIKVADELCLTPVNTTADANPGEQINESTVLYSNSATDTDTAVRATATGVAIIYTLRGTLAPDTFKLKTGFDEMGELEKLPDGTIAFTLPEEGNDALDYEDPEDDPSQFNLGWLSDTEKQQTDGVYYLNSAQEQVTSRTVAAVMPEPYAEDANGDEIPVTYTLNAGVISMRLAPLPGQNPVAPFTLVASVSATPTRNDCRGSSPCGSFKSNKAAKWARVWGDRGSHPWYYYWGANNCTNFISGALYTSHNPKYRGRGGGNMFMSNEYARATKPGTWYYRRNRSGSFSDANNWRLANLLPRYLYKYKLANQVSGNPANWRRGDIVLYQNYNKYEDYPSGKGVYYHIQMVTNTNKNGVPLLGQDAGTHYGEKNWKKVVASNNNNWGEYKTGDRGDPHKLGWGYHVLRPVHRGINVGTSNIRTEGIGD